jgi:putative transposase
VSEQTIYSWRKRFGAMQTDDMKRLKQFEAENARLKKLLAAGPRDRGDEGDRRKKVVSVPARRLQVVYATGKGPSHRRACTLLQEARSALTVPVGAHGEGRAGAGADDGVVGAISALRLSAQCDFPGP